LNRGCWVFLLLLLLSPPLSADWESVGPEGGQISYLAQSTVDPDVIFALSGSSPAKVMRSDDLGLTWNMAGTFNGSPYSLAMNPSGTLMCGASSYFYYSTNGGASWSSVYQANTIFNDIAPHPTNPQTVYAAAYRYNGTNWQMTFCKSTDGGASWTYLPLINTSDTSYGYGIAVSESNPQTIYVCGYLYSSSTYAPKLFRSTDGGVSFTEVTPSGCSSEYYAYSVAVHPTNPSIVLLGTLYGIWRSTDGGTSWSDVSSTVYNYSLTFSPANSDIVIAGGYNGVHRSTNAGASWTTSTSGITGTGLCDVVAHSGDQTKAFTGSTAGFFRSVNTASSWTLSNSGLVVGRDMAIAVAPSQQSLVFKQMQGAGVWKSTNYGAAWTPLTMPLSCGDFCGIVFDPANPATILALEGSG